MKNSKITQGKWTISDQGDNGLYIKSEDGSGAIAKIYRENSIIKNDEEALANLNVIALAGNLSQKYNLEAFEEMLDALVHCKKVFQNLADKGLYPVQLMPESPEFMGKAGFRFIYDAIKKANYEL